MFSRNLRAFALGVLLVMVAAEGILRIGAHFSSWRRPDLVALPSAGIRILCLGNSHTAGYGASPGQGYPEQLERELRTRLGREDIHVINGGVNNATTTYIVQSLPGLLEKFHPSIVFAMMGEPNGWNPLAYHPTEKEQHPLRLLNHLALVRLVEHVWFQQLRRPGPREAQAAPDFHAMPEMVFPLVERWAGDAQRDGSFVGKALTEEEKNALLAYFEERLDPKKAEIPVDLAVLKARLLVAVFHDEGGALALMARVMPPKVPHYSFMAYTALRQMPEPSTSPARKLRSELLRASEKVGPPEALYQKVLRWENGQIAPPEALADEEKGIAFMTQVIKVEPGHPEAYVRKAALLRARGRYLESVRVILDAWRSATQVPRQYSPRSYILPKTDTERSSYPIALALVETAEREGSLRTPGQSAVGALSDEEFAAWIENDFGTIFRMLKERNITLVLQTYPPEHADHFRRRDERAFLHGLIRKFASEERVPLLDSYRDLHAYFDRLPDNERESHYASPFSNTDDHLNQRGYGLLAGMMAQYLLKNERGLAEGSRKP